MTIITKDWTISAERCNRRRESLVRNPSNREQNGNTKSKEAEDTMKGIKLSFLLKVLNDDLLTKVQNHDPTGIDSKGITMDKFLTQWNQILKEQVRYSITLYVL